MKKRTVLVAALGYFVDVFDLFLFSVLRVPSLGSIGVTNQHLLSEGVFILNCQLFGLVIGSLIWGILGDRRGRLSALYGSIFLYSIATLLNAFVSSVSMYALCRFVAGVGLAGELGAAVTLVSEVLSAKNRGWGTTLVAAVGLSGGIAASLAAQYFPWQTCYIIGATLGFFLLIIRLPLKESQIFKAHSKVKGRGSLLLLFSRRTTVLRFISLLLVGVPIWYVAGILMVFSPEISKGLDIIGAPVIASRAIMFSYVGVVFGDLLSGFLSQWLRRRKLVVILFLLLLAVATLLFFRLNGAKASTFYLMCFIIGVATGYWVLLITIAAESFGTNLRATVTTTVPNFVRASAIPLAAMFKMLTVSFGVITAALVLGIAVMVLAVIASMRLNESFGSSLDYVESLS